MKTNAHRHSIHSRLDISSDAALVRLVAPLVLGALALSGPVKGEVVSDFSTATWEWVAGSSPPVTFAAADGQLKIGAQFKQPTNPNAAGNTYANMGWTNELRLVLGQTLEVRVDLISVSQADVFAFLGWSSNWNPGEAYVLMANPDELGLMKAHQGPNSFSFPFWETMPTIEGPVTLALRLTPTGERGSSLLITTTVLDRGTGAVLHHRRYLDTPQVDAVVPSPGPHGIRSRVPEPGRAYTGGGFVPWVGIWHVTDGQQPPVELVLDNLEYAYLPTLAIENAVLLTWPTTSEQFEVWGALKVAGTWEKLTEPVFEVNGMRQMTVPVSLADTMKIFQLQQVRAP
ncbi:MAG: hypothetical protein FJ387_20085 [Verrucomicrobia bacterium]|nr:hypothetical protein [Verrucomicrobiota bacterium]